MNSWIVRLIDQSGYLGIAFLMFLETVFPPVPSELIMPVAGMASAQGDLKLGWVIASGTAGAMLGNVLWYLAARALGILRLKPIVLRWGRWLGLSWTEVLRAQRWFRGHGIAFVLFGRLVPTVRSLVSLPAGLLQMRFRDFFLASTVGTAAWTALLAVAGQQMGSRYGKLADWLGPISIAVLVGIGLIYVWRVWTHRDLHAGEED